MNSMANKSKVSTGTAVYRAVRSERLSDSWEVWADYPKPRGSGTVPLQLCKYLSEANARLFASAPELLAVCEAVAEPKPFGDPRHVDFSEAIKMARAALARVRGEAVRS